MLSLMYVSTARPGLTGSEVEALAQRVAQNNARQEVTGLLAFNSRNFMQLLEGVGEKVLGVMRTIERDDRHHDITYIRQDTRAHRECPDWSMRSLITPLTGLGSASVFTGSLPRQMELDTKILFTSFASSLTAAQEAQHAEAEQRAMQDRGAAEND